jgi:hypothetical protein
MAIQNEKSLQPLCSNLRPSARKRTSLTARQGSTMVHVLPLTACYWFCIGFALWVCFCGDSALYKAFIYFVCHFIFMKKSNKTLLFFFFHCYLYDFLWKLCFVIFQNSDWKALETLFTYHHADLAVHRYHSVLTVSQCCCCVETCALFILSSVSTFGIFQVRGRCLMVVLLCFVTLITLLVHVKKITYLYVKPPLCQSVLNDNLSYSAFFWSPWRSLEMECIVENIEYYVSVWWKCICACRFAILSNFPETTSPAEYRSLLPELG